MSQIKRLQTIDADTLQSTAYEPVSFVVDDLLPQGLHLLAGAPKIGKSWLALWLCLCAAQGKPLWTFATRPCEVLYLCLEDSFQRIQSRLFDLTEDAPPTLHFAVMSQQLHNGLVEQIGQFLKEHPQTRLIVIDTLQRIRTAGNDANPYASDYRDIGVLKALADKHRVTLLAVTDHDTFDGAAQLLGKPAPMPILQGVELSLRDMPGLHLLGYGRGTDTPLHRKVRALSQMRLGRARQMVEKLNALGYPLDYDEIAREAKGSVGRPHIARAMVSRGYVADTREAFDRFLADGAPAYVAGERLSMAEALPLMQESGFVPVLAHPMELEKTGALLRHLLGAWQEQGLRGVEVYHPSAGRATPLLDLTARRMGFLVTGGSDFHGDGDRHGMVGCTAPMWARAADDVEKLLQAVEAAEIM